MPSDVLMPLAQYGVLVLFIVAMVGSPGPANMSLMASGVAFGARPAVPFLLGTMSGFQIIFWLNVLGLYALLQGAPQVFELLRWLCIGYIVYLAWTIVRSGSGAGDAGGFRAICAACGCTRSVQGLCDADRRDLAIRLARALSCRCASRIADVLGARRDPERPVAAGRRPVADGRPRVPFPVLAQARPRPPHGRLDHRELANDPGLMAQGRSRILSR
ncbi:MAG: LysE family translocator [Alphaproteobacteria bacterium]|nr:LysE family translocator [Alphaproteobacteria bacterium]